MTAKALVEAIAALVIFLTLAGLGLFQVPSDEPTIEAGLQAQAAALLADLPNPPELTVSGREITVEGRVESHAVRRRILSDLRGIEGVKEVKTNLQVLPEVAQFSFSLTGDADGVAMAGHVRRADTIERLVDLAGAPVPGIALARGTTFDGWDAAVVTLAQAVAGLDRAEVMMTGAEVRVSGQAAWPSDLVQVERQLADLPTALTVNAQLTARDDGAPFLLVAEKQPRLDVGLRGKLPPSLAPDDLIALFGQVKGNALVVAPVDPGLPALGPAMLRAAQVLAAAEEGVAVVTPGAVVLSGLRGGADMDRALTDMRTALPSGHLVQVSRLPAPQPEPFWLELARLRGTVTARGVVPQDLAPSVLSESIGGADTSKLRQSPYPDTNGWLDGLDAVRAVFAEVVEGAILLEEDSVTLDAVLPDPDSAVRTDALLAALPQAQDFRRYVELVDDGQTLDATVTYSPAKGARIDGALPSDLAADQVAALLGLPDVAGAPGRDKEQALPRAQSVLQAVARWLGEAEDLTLALAPGALMLDAVLSPGVDLPQIEEAMRAVLGPSDGLNLRLLSDYPPETTHRQNIALGASQVFVAGYWLPVLDFTPSVAECARQSRFAEIADPVRFLSGSTRLDARSIRGVNALAAVARVCILEGGLTVQVEGHTDSFGAVSMNEAISRQRADVVAVEITQRGVPSGAIGVVGYGPARPVADNGTEEGRARNRRISLAWDDPEQESQ